MNPNNKGPLKIIDFKWVGVCLLIGLMMCTGILCLFLGIFYNRELQIIGDKIDGMEVKK